MTALANLDIPRNIPILLIGYGILSLLVINNVYLLSVMVHNFKKTV